MEGKKELVEEWKSDVVPYLIFLLAENVQTWSFHCFCVDDEGQ